MSSLRALGPLLAPFLTPLPIRAAMLCTVVVSHGLPTGSAPPALCSPLLLRHSHIKAKVLLLLKVVIEDKLADEVGVQGVVDHLGAPELRGWFREGNPIIPTSLPSAAAPALIPD